MIIPGRSFGFFPDVSLSLSKINITSNRLLLPSVVCVSFLEIFRRACHFSFLAFSEVTTMNFVREACDFDGLLE